MLPDVGAPPLTEQVAGPKKPNEPLPPWIWTGGVSEVVLPVNWHAAVVAACAEAAPPPTTPMTASDASSASLILDKVPPLVVLCRAPESPRRGVGILPCHYEEVPSAAICSG